MSVEFQKNNISSKAAAPGSVPGETAASEKGVKPKKTEKRKKRGKVKVTVPLFKRPLVCPPEAADRTASSVAWGWVMRGAVLFVAVFGMSLLVCDALGFTKAESGALSGWVLALGSLIFTVGLALCTLSATKKYAIPAFCLLLAGGAALMAVQNIFEYLFRAVTNNVVAHLYSRGFLSVIQYQQSTWYGEYTLPWLTSLAAVLITLFYALAYVPFLMRRTRLAVPVTVSVLTLVPVFVYNLTRSNWGVTMVIAGFSGVLVMCVYDRYYQRRPNADEFDTETDIFEVEGVPEMPEELTSREQRRLDRKNAVAERKASRRAKREAEKRRRRKLRGKEKMNADEDISDYFAPRGRKRSEKKPKVRAERLTPEARAALRVTQRAEKDEKRRAEKARRLETRRRDRDILAARRRAKAGAREITLLRASSGGYAGAAMLLLALLILVIPAVTTNENFRLIEAIDSKMEYYRKYVTAFLMGDDPLLDELAYEGRGESFEPRSTEAKHLSYTGVKLMEVQTPVAYPVYLRGWIATDYDGDAGAWVTASPTSDTFKEYRASFGSAADPAEQMFYETFKYISPGTVADVPFANKRYINNTSKYGFVAMQVNMKRLDLKSYLAYMPSFTNRRYSPESTTLGGKKVRVMRLWGGSEASKLSYTNYFDGIYTGYRFYDDKDGYASVAYVTSMKNTGFYKNLAQTIVSFNTDRMLIEKDKAEKAEAVKLYGHLPQGVGEFRVHESFGGNYYVTRPDGRRFYSVSYDNTSGSTTIRVFGDGVTSSYYYDSAGKLLSQNTKTNKQDPDDEVRYISTPELPAVIRYLEFYTDAERSELEQAWRLSDSYTRYVYDTYTGKADSDVISGLVKKIIDEAHTETVEYTEDGEEIKTIVPKDFSLAADRCVFNEKAPYDLLTPVSDVRVYEQRHKLVMEFINWLKENCKYTLTPTLSDAEGYDGVEKFLALTHEGYCVQFASSLALMLREAGIPARYVEGYIASDFGRSVSGGASNYTAYVRDSSAHAWVEVWYDSIGWVQYEATPEYYSGMYEYYSSEPIPITPIVPGGDDEPEDPEDPGLTDAELAELIKQQELAARRKRIVRITIVSLVILLLAAAVLAVFLILGRRAKRKAAEREAVVSRLETVGRRGAEPIPDGEARRLARRLGDMLSLLLELCGCAPKEGEFRAEYAARLHGELGEYLRAQEEGSGSITLSELERDLDAIAAAEFGGEGVKIPAASLSSLARLWRRLYGKAYPRRVGRLKRVVTFYFKQTL